MKALMIIASFLVVGAGAFCIANSSVPFISVAFIVGATVIFLGITEFLVSRIGEIHTSRRGEVWISVESWVAIILGVVFISGQVSDDITITALFAMWTTIEGLKSISSVHMNLRTNTASANIEQILGLVTTLLGVYMFFNSALLNVRVLILIGLSLMMIGINCFKIAILVQYKKPEFLTSSSEKLQEAKNDEKTAMDKAKEAIRETNEARERIRKYTAEVERDRHLSSELTERHRTRENRD